MWKEQVFEWLYIRSLCKNLHSLKECIKSLDCKFDVIGVSETHLKDKPNDLLKIDGFDIEYTSYICISYPQGKCYNLALLSIKKNASILVMNPALLRQRKIMLGCPHHRLDTPRPLTLY